MSSVKKMCKSMQNAFAKHMHEPFEDVQRPISNCIQYERNYFISKMDFVE